MKRKCFDETTEQVIARLADMPDGRITVLLGRFARALFLHGG